MCSRQSNEDLKQQQYTLDSIPSDEEAKAFFKVLGDMGRAESKRFSDEHHGLIERLRDANRLVSDKNALDFKYRLLCEAILEPGRGSTLNLNPQQRVGFLERLYEECLGFYFRMWNEPLPDAEEESERIRLERLLGRQSTREILAAFTGMIASIKNTVGQTTPLASKVFESDEAFEKARLAILKPSAIAYDSLQRLTESHLAELKGGLTTAFSPTGSRFAAPGG